MLLETKISRRRFMKTAGGLTFAFSVAGGLTGRAAQVFAAESARMNAWVTIGVDDIVTVMMPVSEMGQGTLTALPLILAEELDADWSKVRAEYAPTIPKIYGNYHPAFNGAQINAYSAAVATTTDRSGSPAHRRAACCSTTSPGNGTCRPRNSPPSRAWWCTPDPDGASPTAMS